LTFAARNCVLHGDLDDVADAGIAALGAAQHLDAHQFARAGIVRRQRGRSASDHGDFSSQTFGYCAARVTISTTRKVLGLRQRRAFNDAHHVAFLALALLVVGVQLGRTDG
jgi:hypothetical protein